MFHERAEKVEHALAIWDQLFYQAALPAGPTGNVLQAWAAVAADADRRFSMYLEEAQLGDDFSVLHNPLASHPLNPSTFDWCDQYFYRDGVLDKRLANSV